MAEEHMKEETVIREDADVNKDTSGGRGEAEATGIETGVSEKDVDEPKRKKSLFRKLLEDREVSRDYLILSRIRDEHLMEYLQLEQKRAEAIQKVKDARARRILSAFQLAVSLASVIAVTFLLKDNPTVLVNILYIIGIIAALWIWKNPKEK